jgi:hypothetical protein
MTGFDARNISGLWGRNGNTFKPGTIVTGNQENEIPRSITGWQVLLAGDRCCFPCQDMR